MLSWQLALLVRIVVGNALLPVLIKKQADKKDKYIRFFLQFQMSAVISTVLFALFATTFEPATLLVTACLGAFTVSGTFFQWKSLAVSGAKTSVLAFMDDVIAIILSVVFLREWERATPIAGVGVFLCGCAIVLFIARARAREQAKDGSALPARYLANVFTYSAIWGVSYFLQNVFAVKSVGMINLIGGWYIGGSIVSLFLVRYVAKERNVVAQIALIPKLDVLMIAAIALCVVGCMCLQYTIYHQAIQLAAQPVILVGEMVLQALVFLLVFKKERREFDRHEIGASFIALIGTLLIMGFQA